MELTDEGSGIFRSSNNTSRHTLLTPNRRKRGERVNRSIAEPFESNGNNLSEEPVEKKVKDIRFSKKIKVDRISPEKSIPENDGGSTKECEITKTPHPILPEALEIAIEKIDAVMAENMLKNYNDSFRKIITRSKEVEIQISFADQVRELNLKRNLFDDLIDATELYKWRYPCTCNF